MQMIPKIMLSKDYILWWHVYNFLNYKDKRHAVSSKIYSERESGKKGVKETFWDDECVQLI